MRDLFRRLLLAGIALIGAASVGQAGQFTEIVAFGDSLTDTGNLYAATRGAFPPSQYDQGRFSNGPTWVENLATQLGLAAPAPSLLGGTNYAWGGAETGLSGLSNRGTPNIGTQISTYLGSHPTVGRGDLIALWGGANDFLNSGQTNASIPVSNLAAEITLLASHGATSFLVPNLPLLGKTPRYVGTANESVFNGYTLSFNSQLAAALDGLQSSLGIHIYQLDTHGLLNQILANPSAYRFTNTTGSALQVPGGGVGAGIEVPNPDQYVFWDDIHPTRVTHRLIGQAAATLVVPAPPSVGLMTVGLIFLVAGGRWAQRLPGLVRRVEA